jgi:Uma2 family endonuclease
LRLDRYNEPEPDICIVKKKDYSSQHPGSSDVILVIEVADSSLSYDMEIKVPLFAKHKIPEVWIVDLTKNTLHVFSDPKSGTYQQSATYTSGTANSSLVPALILDLDTFWNS